MDNINPTPPQPPPIPPVVAQYGAATQRPLGESPEERAPIQFLMASCLLRLGKNAEAVELLREAANSRIDERTAGYAQWELEMQRWQREMFSG